MARTDTVRHFLTDIANSIRNKKGTTDTIIASNFDTEIDSIETSVGKYTPRFISFYNYVSTKAHQYSYQRHTIFRQSRLNV